ncbi:MAG TPA: glycosyltransferase family 9 protein [Reyranella sp.]|nr:glycosyltransferase family 9 protein [Reyranella sp.]
MNILLIRLRLIGDVVFTTPIPRALKRAFPGSRITYLVEPAAAPVVNGNPHLDEVIVAPRPAGLARIVADLRLARQLRKARYDLVIDLHGGPRSAWLARATGAPQRIGYVIQGRTWMYTRAVSRPRVLRRRHSVVNQWDLLEAIDGWPLSGPEPAVDPVEMAADPSAAARIEQRLRAAGIAPDAELIVAHVSAGNPFRRWPEPAFASLVSGLARASPRRRIVLSSGPSDREAAARIAAEARKALGEAADRVVDFGEFDLAELRALVERSRLFVGGDTGPLHIAATTATPIVGIYGPTEAVRSAPWRDPRVPTEAVEVAGLPCRPCDQRICEPGDFRCLTTLRPEDVLSAAERAMNRRA